MINEYDLLTQWGAPKIPTNAETSFIAVFVAIPIFLFKSFRASTVCLKHLARGVSHYFNFSLISLSSAEGDNLSVSHACEGRLGC